jgi:hypothetical protein
MTGTNRRKFLAGGAGATAVRTAGKAKEKAAKRVTYPNGKKADNPLFSSTVAYGNLLRIAGVRHHSEGDIKKVHTRPRLGFDQAAARKCRIFDGESPQVRRLLE